MTPAQLERIEEIFYASLDQEPDQVNAFLETACEGDQLLRRKVEALLASHPRVGSFIATSAVGLATKIIQNGQADLLVGQTIGHYKLSERIGIGGMGEVYLATDITAGRKAALKLLPVRFTGDAERLKRFQREARAVVGLNHPNILTVYEIGEHHSTHYIASELIEGETLRQRLMRGRIEVGEAVDVAIQVASALAAAHEAGIVHRDIKPENIMLRRDGYVKVLDFGIAKLAESAFAEPPSVAAATFGVPGATADVAESMTLAATNLGSILGTVRYMSPEQACGAQVDKSTDIWNLGVVLYEMVTGHAPFTGDPPSLAAATYGEAGTPGAVISSILEKEPPPLTRYIKHTPAELQQIISKTLRKNREERYHSAHELLEALKDLRHKLEFGAELERATAATSWLRWTRSPTALVLVLLMSALALALPFYWHQNLATSLPPEKSIAVLPFQNLSEEKANAYFAEGIQNEILTKLATVRDLKVISRTSTAKYQSKPDNLKRVAQELGVSTILEGTVQRAGDKVRVNVQLIDARTDAHLWAQTYDRDLADVFAIQSEIAKAIADQLQAKLSPNEKKAIEQPPTTDLAAFDLYSRAKSLLLTAFLSATNEPDLRKAIELLDEAVKRDPSFFDAYCQLAWAHEYLYAVKGDHTPARLALAEAAVQAATRLRRDAAETHWARAQYLYNGLRDYAGALAELEIARRALPNDPRLFELTGYILRRRGQHEEGLRNLERAAELDPRNFYILQQIALSYQFLRHYAESIAALDRALAIVPDNVETRANRGLWYMCWKADTQPLRQTIDAILAQGPDAVGSAADTWFFCALAERDPAAAERALVALGHNPCWGKGPITLSRSFGEGLLARMTKDEARARTAFEAARAQQEKIVQAQPDYGPALCVLGLIDAALGRKDLALDEGRRAVALTPVEKDAINGSRVLQYFAITAAWAGEKELALQQLEAGLRAPVASDMLSYGALKLLPFWDPLRGDPRFDKIVAAAKAASR
jgi:serine/threonine protein kinase/Tfp pilus assembly protein PilF